MRRRVSILSAAETLLPSFSKKKQPTKNWLLNDAERCTEWNKSNSVATSNGDQFAYRFADITLFPKKIQHFTSFDDLFCVEPDHHFLSCWFFSLFFSTKIQMPPPPAECICSVNNCIADVSSFWWNLKRAVRLSFTCGMQTLFDTTHYRLDTQSGVCVCSSAHFGRLVSVCVLVCAVADTLA